MARFNVSNVEVRFIHSLLKNTYLPILPTVTVGDYLVEGANYVYKDKIVHCKKSGELVDTTHSKDSLTYVHRTDSTPQNLKLCAAVSSLALCGPRFICGMGPKRAEYSVEQTFSYSKPAYGLTYRYESPSDTYDVNTHIHLGRYLRWYRDNKGVDLMPLYNCFTGEDTSFVHIKGGKLTEGNDPTKTTWIVPAQLNKKYSIYINSSRPVSVCGAFLNDFGRVRYRGLENIKFVDEMLDNKVVECFNSNYNHPISFKTDTDRSELISFTNNFYIILQTDKSHNSSIVVIEGEEHLSDSKFITSREIFLDTQDYSRFNPGIKSSLVIFPSNHQIPYSSRLIEFLTEQAITSEEDIPKNIGRVQKALGVRGQYRMTEDVWDETLRYILYNNYFKYVNDYSFDRASLSQSTLRTIVKEKKIPEDRLVYLKNSEGKFIDEDGTLIEDKNGNIQIGKEKVIVGLKNLKSRQHFDNPYDITGYVDKDMENSLFKYRSVV
jgi:hypothetical protein